MRRTELSEYTLKPSLREAPGPHYCKGSSILAFKHYFALCLVYCCSFTQRDLLLKLQPNIPVLIPYKSSFFSKPNHDHFMWTHSHLLPSWANVPILCLRTLTILCVPSLFEETDPDPIKLHALIVSFRTCGLRVRVCMKTGGGAMPHNRLRSVTMEINNSCWRKWV